MHVCIGCHFSNKSKMMLIRYTLPSISEYSTIFIYCLETLRYLIDYICVFSLQPVQQQRNRRLSIVVAASPRQSVPICSKQTQINLFKQIDHSNRESYATIRNNPNLFNREIISRHRDKQQFEYDRHRSMICIDHHR